jgi:hypothetical protein
MVMYALTAEGEALVASVLDSGVSAAVERVRG